MGGVTLYVPDNWVVEFHGTPIMGGFEDQSRPPAGEVRGRLILSGVVLLVASWSRTEPCTRFWPRARASCSTWASGSGSERC